MKRILIVDDDATTRRLLAEAMAIFELEVHFCSDGIHALDALRCNSGYDLVITDVGMPVLDGRQLVTAMKTDSLLRGIPILVTSGIVGGREINDLMEAGADGFIAKPLNLASVRDEVAGCLRLGAPTIC